MKRKYSTLIVISIILYILGFSISTAFNSLVLYANLEGQSFWGYPESIAYDSSLTREARISRVKCPVLLTPGESKTVKLTVRNPNDFPIEAWVSTHISMPDMFESMVRDLTSVPLAPGEKSTLSWEINEDNIIRNRIILTRAFLRLTDRHPPSRTSHCGIVVLDLWGLPSSVVMILALFVGHLVQAFGIWSLWQGRLKIGKRDNFLRNILIALSIFSIMMTIGSLLHSWVFSLMGLLLTLLLIFTAFGYRIGKSDLPIN